MLRLKTLGSPTVEGDGGLLRGAAAQRKPLALLALLALTYERPLSRDKIVAYLWPEAEPEKAAHRLNQLLYALRRDLGSDTLFLGSSDLRLNPDVLTIDVADFRSHIRRGELEQAVAVYGGPFLDGFYLDGALEFERWTEEERANLAKRYGSALEALALAAVKRGDLVAAGEYRRKLAQADPLNSRAALDLIEVLHAAGDPTAALEAAKVHQAHLREEVDAAVDPAVASLVERIRLAMGTQDSTPAYSGSLEPQTSRPQTADKLLHTLETMVTPSEGSTPIGSSPVPGLTGSTARPAPVFGSARIIAIVGGLMSHRPARWITSIVAACVAAFLVVGGLLLRRGHAGPPERAAGPPVLAVLPFENIGPAEQEYFADGMTDAVRGKLAGLAGFRVIARGSSAQYKKTHKTPQQIGEELAAQYLLTATVRWERGRSGTNRVQVSPELIHVSDATARWQQAFDANLSDVFEVQADIAARVAQALDVAMRSTEREHLAEPPTSNVAAYDDFLRGEDVSNSLSLTVPSILRQAAGYYAAAVALDSTFALGWAQLARAHARIFRFVESRPSDAERARVAAVRALALAPGAVEGRFAMGEYYALVLNDHIRALEQYEAAQRVWPASADLLASVASEEASLGRWDQGIAHFEQAQALDPRSLRTAQLLAFSLLWVRRYPQALATADRALALAPSVPTLHTKVMVYLAQGDLVTARQVIRDALTQIDSTSLVSFFARYFDLYWVLDQEQQALLLRLTPKAFDGNRAAWGGALAGMYALRGDPARARAYADSARLAAEAQVRAGPDLASGKLGVANAYLGRRNEAIRAGERAVAFHPVAKDATIGAHVQHQLARIYLLVGEPEKALDQLEPLLKIPYYLSPAWLGIDPTFSSLRGNPRFERLITSTELLDESERRPPPSSE